MPVASVPDTTIPMEKLYTQKWKGLTPQKKKISSGLLGSRLRKNLKFSYISLTCYVCCVLGRPCCGGLPAEHHSTCTLCSRRCGRKGNMYIMVTHLSEHHSTCTPCSRWCGRKAGLGKRSFQKNTTFLRSFAFFIKEHFVLCILLHSL